MRWILVAAFAVGSLVIPSTHAGAQTPRSSGPTQVITVSAKGPSTTYAKLTAWERVNGQWSAVMAFPARIGGSGFSTMGIGQRRQHSGTTPVGAYSVGTGFGRKPNPGTAMPWRQVDGDDYWVYDPKDPSTYNQLVSQRGPGAKWRPTSRWSERLASYKTYSFAFVIGFNLPGVAGPANTRMGGGIFLHVNGAGATAGCVSISKSGMKSIARWLRPSASPQIVMGPRKTVRTLTPFARS